MSDIQMSRADPGSPARPRLGRTARPHETLAKLYRDFILSKLNSLEEPLNHYSSGWDHNWHDNVLVLRKGFEPGHHRQAGIEALTRYYHRYHPFDQSRTLAAEHPTRTNLDGYTLKGVCFTRTVATANS